MVPTAQLMDACAQVRAGDLKEGMGRLLALRADHVENRETFGHADLATLLTTLVECRLARGELAEAMVLGDDLAPYLESDADPASALPSALAHQARADLAAALGDAELALHHYNRAGATRARRAARTGCPGAAAPRWRTCAAATPATASALAREQVDHRPGLGLAVRHGDRPAHPRRGRHRHRPGPHPAPAAGPGASSSGNRADRLAAQIDTDLAGLLLLTHAADAEQRALALLRSAEEHAGRQELWPLQGRVRRLLDRLGSSRARSRPRRWPRSPRPSAGSPGWPPTA